VQTVDKCVARFADGRVLKGATTDFSTAEDHFHLIPANDGASKTTQVHMPDLKAVFGVKTFAGDPRHVEKKTFDGPEPPDGAVRVVFSDGEVLVGTTDGVEPDRPGFFVVPADPDSNNVWAYVVTEATREICLL
jgi:hypothetical protein